MYVCRYVFNLVQLVDTNVKVKMTDVLSNLANISNHELFDFNGTQIDRMRTEIYDVLARITDIYQNHRVLTGPDADAVAAFHSLSDDDSASSSSDDDDDDDNVSIKSRMSMSQEMDDSDVSEWYPDEADDGRSLPSQYDEDDDDVLSADTNGELAH